MEHINLSKTDAVLENATFYNESVDSQISQWNIYRSSSTTRYVLIFLEVVVGVAGLFLQCSMSLVCWRLRQRRYKRGRANTVMQERIINNLTMAQFITVTVVWVLTIPIMILRTSYLQHNSVMEGLCLFWTFCKVITFYLLNFVYLGNTVVRFLYSGYLSTALTLESKRPTRYIMTANLVLAMALAVKRVYFRKNSTVICYSDLDSSSNDKQPGGTLIPIVFGVIPLILNGVLNIFIFIFRKKNLEKLNSDNKTARKSQTWASAKVHFATVSLYAYIVVVSMCKSFILKGSMHGPDAVAYNLGSDLHMNVILGIILPIIYLVASPKISERCRTSWRLKKREESDWTSEAMTPPTPLKNLKKFVKQPSSWSLTSKT